MLSRMNRTRLVASAALLFCAASLPCFGVPLLTPGDTIFGGQSDGTNFNVGTVGFTGGANNWPGGEPPEAAIDGVGQKYLNFGELNTGFLVTPSVGAAAGGTRATSIKLWTANDAPDRDPASYSLFGTNSVIIGGGPFALSSFSLISSGSLALPTTRNTGGAAPLDDANSQTVSFANAQAFRSYLVIFPTVKNEAGANSMQIAEVQLDGTVVPEPGTFGLLGLMTAGVFAFRRSRR